MTACVYMCIVVCICVCVLACVYACMCVHMHACVYVCVLLCVCVYACLKFCICEKTQSPTLSQLSKHPFMNIFTIFFLKIFPPKTFYISLHTLQCSSYVDNTCSSIHIQSSQKLFTYKKYKVQQHPMGVSIHSQTSFRK